MYDPVMGEMTPVQAATPAPAPPAPPQAVGSVPGHNMGFIDIISDLNTTLFDEVTARIQPSTDEVDKIIAAVDAIVVGTEITTQAEHDAAADAARRLTQISADLEKRRKADTDPVNKAKDYIDTPYNNLRRKALAKAATLVPKVTIFLQKIARAEQMKRDDEARALREEAERRAAMAREAEERARTDRDVRVAIQSADIAKTAEIAAVKAEKAVDASPADLARQRTASGVVSTLKREKVVVIDKLEEIDLNDLRAYIKRDTIESAVRAAFKADPKRVIKGARYEETTGASFK